MISEAWPRLILPLPRSFRLFSSDFRACAPAITSEISSGTEPKEPRNPGPRVLGFSNLGFVRLTVRREGARGRRLTLVRFAIFPDVYRLVRRLCVRARRRNLSFLEGFSREAGFADADLKAKAVALARVRRLRGDRFFEASAERFTCSVASISFRLRLEGDASI